MTPICWAYVGRAVELTHFHRHSGAAFGGRSEWLGTDAADVPVTSGSIVEQLDGVEDIGLRILKRSRAKPRFSGYETMPSATPGSFLSISAHGMSVDRQNKLRLPHNPY